MSAPGNMWRKVHGRITRKPSNFSWIIDGRLAGSGLPTSRAEFDWVMSQGVESVVTMTENPLPSEWIESSGTAYMHVPTPDLEAPAQEGLDGAADFIDARIREGRPAMVHCAAGMGRAGTVLACYLVKHAGYTAEQAIREIRAMRPGSIQSGAQELAVRLFEKRCAGSSPDGAGPVTRQ